MKTPSDDLTGVRSLRRWAISLLCAVAWFPLSSHAQVASIPTCHFESICRSDPSVKKNEVQIVLHDVDHLPMAGVTVTVLWTFVDYRQNHAVFKYRLDSGVTDRNGTCKFSGGSGRARWQFAEVLGYELDPLVFDDPATVTCPNTLMIDFW